MERCLCKIVIRGMRMKTDQTRQQALLAFIKTHDRRGIINNETPEKQQLGRKGLSPE